MGNLRHNVRKIKVTIVNKGPITWRISARAEISAWLGGLSFQPGFLNKINLLKTTFIIT